MTSDLSPDAVAARLARLRELYVPATRAEVEGALVPPPRAPAEFAELVSRRLEELRALCDLTRYLHARARGGV
jgi:hypothetical protein